MGETREITEQQRWQLVGLLTLADSHEAALTGIRRAALEITGEDDDMGHTADAVAGYPLGDPVERTDELLRRLGLTVAAARGQEGT